MYTLFISSLLFFPVLFVICFVVAVVVVLLLAFKVKTVKKILLIQGYSPDMVNTFLSPTNAMRNIQDAVAYGYFTFNHYLVFNFGKDIFSYADKVEIKPSIENLRKTYKLYIKLLITGFALIIISMISMYLIAYFFGSYF